MDNKPINVRQAFYDPSLPLIRCRSTGMYWKKHFMFWDAYCYNCVGQDVWLWAYWSETWTQGLERLNTNPDELLLSILRSERDKKLAVKGLSTSLPWLGKHLSSEYLVMSMKNNLSFGWRLPDRFASTCLDSIEVVRAKLLALSVYIKSEAHSCHHTIYSKYSVNIWFEVNTLSTTCERRVSFFKVLVFYEWQRSFVRWAWCRYAENQSSFPT